MLLDEDPAALIHECIANFALQPDRSALSRIHSSLSTLSEARSLRLTQLNTSLKRLQRQYSTLQQQHDLDMQKYSASEHAQKILEMDGKKFRVAKEASEAEIDSERLEVECAQTEAQLEELVRQGREGGGARSGRAGDDKLAEQAVLKLKLYRSLGIDLEPDAQGQFSKAVVRNVQKGMVSVIPIDGTLPRNAYAERIWQAV